MSGQPLLDDDTQPSIDLSNQPESVILVTDSVQSTIEIQSESDNLLQQCSNNKLYGLKDSDIGNCEVVVEHRETADSNNLLQQCLNDSDIVNCEVVIERKDIVGSNNLLQQCSDLTKEKDTSHSDQMHSVVMSIEQVNDEANPDSDNDIVIVYENVYGGIDKLPKVPKYEPVKPENLSTEEKRAVLDYSKKFMDHLQSQITTLESEISTEETNSQSQTNLKGDGTSSNSPNNDIQPTTSSGIVNTDAPSTIPIIDSSSEDEFSTDTALIKSFLPNAGTSQNIQFTNTCGNEHASIVIEDNLSKLKKRKNVSFDLGHNTIQTFNLKEKLTWTAKPKRNLKITQDELRSILKSIQPVDSPTTKLPDSGNVPASPVNFHVADVNANLDHLPQLPGELMPRSTTPSDSGFCESFPKSSTGKSSTHKLHEKDSVNPPNHIYNSQSFSLSELKEIMSKPSFCRINKGLRGLISKEIVSDEDFSELAPWEIPGALYCLNPKHEAAEVSRLYTNHLISIGKTPPNSAFKLKELNIFIMDHLRAAVPGLPTLNELRESDILPCHFQKIYSWVDPNCRSLTDSNITCLLKNTPAEFMTSQVAPWPCTLMPRDPEDRKYFSIFDENGLEYVCRTLAQRHKGYNGYQIYTEDSEIFICEFCKNIIATEYHVYVSAYVFEKNHDFDKLMAWRRTFLKICYIHFRLTGTKLPGRNIYRDALIGTTSNQPRGSNRSRRGQFRGLGRRGRPVVDW